MSVFIHELTHIIGRCRILDNVTINVRKGSFTCLLGPNGAGKSTLIKLICGLIKRQTGALDIEGKDICSYKRRRLATLVGYVPQTSDSGVRFSVEEYLTTGRYPYTTFLGNLRPEDRQAVESVIVMTGLDSMRSRDMSTLSGGERQRVMIAAALAQETGILLLDEPTIFLDPKSSMDILLLLQRVHLNGVTIFMVTHDINQALLFGTDFVGLKNGRVMFHSESAAELHKGGFLDELFDLRFYRVYNEDDGVLQLLPRVPEDNRL